MWNSCQIHQRPWNLHSLPILDFLDLNCPSQVYQFILIIQRLKTSPKASCMKLLLKNEVNNHRLYRASTFVGCNSFFYDGLHSRHDTVVMEHFFCYHNEFLWGFHILTFGTWGLNSTALWMASTAFISAVLSPRRDAASGENLKSRKTNTIHLGPLLGHQPRVASIYQGPIKP